MRNKVNISFIFIRGVIYTLPFIFFVIVVLYDLNPSGIRHIRYTFDSRSSVISDLFPAHRLHGIKDSRQQVITTPIYFYVRAPHSYDQAVLSVTVNNPTELLWNVGLEVRGDSDWSYALQPAISKNEVKFDLRNAKITERQYRFMISVDEHSDERFTIENIDVTLKRKPLIDLLLSKITS